jgi:hypothetical protein
LVVFDSPKIDQRPSYGELFFNFSRVAFVSWLVLYRVRMEAAMRIAEALIVAGATIASTTAVFAADYRADSYEPRGISPPAVYAAPTVLTAIQPRPMYVPYVPPMYYLPSPPHYVQDLRTGAPGHWVQLQPSFFDRLFGEFRDGY